MLTLERILSKRLIAGCFFVLFWIGLRLIPALPLSVEGWASLIPLRCPLFWLFKIHCPTCGLGRSLVAASLGQWRLSWHFHPLGLPMFWGGQGLFLIWIFSPKGWAAVRLRLLSFGQENKLLLWLLFLAYCIWGFCLRAPIV